MSNQEDRPQLGVIESGKDPNSDNNQQEKIPNNLARRQRHRNRGSQRQRRIDRSDTATISVEEQKHQPNRELVGNEDGTPSEPDKVLSHESKGENKPKRKKNKKKSTKKVHATINEQESTVLNDDAIVTPNDTLQHVEMVSQIERLGVMNQCAGRGKGNRQSKAQQSNKQRKPDTHLQSTDSALPNNKSKPDDRFPWKKFVPPGTMDPISLEPIRSLLYPPFVIKATPPFEPVLHWPTQVSENSELKNLNKVSRESRELDRQRNILLEQWGRCLPQDDSVALPMDSDKSELSTENQLYHFFDGKVLAYYLVSQLQFIDPLNRRELTSDEIIHLDNYLKKNGLSSSSSHSVSEAYNARLATDRMSNESESMTNPVRAFQLQQEARHLLQSLFAGSSRRRGGNMALASITSSTSLNDRESNLDRPIVRNGQNSNSRVTATGCRLNSTNVMSHREMESELHHRPYANTVSFESGVYQHEGGGMLIIDDDTNPGLRGRTVGNSSEYVPSLGSTVLSDLIPSLSTNDQKEATTDEHFPVLTNLVRSNLSLTEHSEPVHHHQDTHKPPARTESAPNLTSTAVPRTLQKISKLIAKTDPKEVEKQRNARAEYQRRSALLNMVYDPTFSRSAPLTPNADCADGHAQCMNISEGISEAMTERNRVIAKALGVVPYTVRAETREFSINSGWARPTKVARDEFGNEPNMITVCYPDSLVMLARDRMPELLKLEKKWIKFLEDDTAASCPLKPMDKMTRAFVHEYSDYWKLHTESFDLPPNRYVHCVKLRDTSAPNLLLSSVARQWTKASTVNGTTINGNQTPSEPFQPTDNMTRSESYHELLQMKARAPLRLLPRKTDDLSGTDVGGSFLGGTSISNRGGNAPCNQEPTARFAPLISERERTKLILQPRSKPLESLTDQDVDQHLIDMKLNLSSARELKSKKRSEAAAKRESALAAAFASDEESDWDVGDAVYSGDEDG